MKYSFQIRNWQQFQHYSHRNPPWIKLHYELLSSADWVILSDASRVLAISCMLVASRHDGMIPENASYLRRVAYLNTEPDFSELLSCGFIIDLRDLQADDSTMLADASVSVSVSVSESSLKKKKESPFLDDSKEVLEHINSVTGRDFGNTREIVSCFKREACTVNDCKMVIDHKWAEWAGTDMAKHVNPVTPFRKAHFNDYLDQSKAGDAKMVPAQSAQPLGNRAYEKDGFAGDKPLGEEERIASEAAWAAMKGNTA